MGGRARHGRRGCGDQSRVGIANGEPGVNGMAIFLIKGVARGAQAAAPTSVAPDS